MLPKFVNRLTDLVSGFARGVFPRSLISFLIVGSLGVVVHMGVLKALMFLVPDSFRDANAAAMIVAASFNYLLNNKATYSHSSLMGKKIIAGYVIYLAITSLGLLLSLLVSVAVFERIDMPMPAAMSGIVVGSLWNYFMSYNFVWRLLSSRFNSANT